MKHVKLINGINEKLVLKEGNAGIYRVVKVIPENGKYSLQFDDTATYREFVCVETKSGLNVTLTSDDLMEYKEVTIEKHANGTLVWKENSKKRNPAPLASDARIGEAFDGVAGGVGGLWHGLLKWLPGFKKKSEAKNEAASRQPQP